MHAAPEPLPRPEFGLTAQDLVTRGHLVPPSAHELARSVNVPAAVALVRALPGVQLVVPRHAAANRSGARRFALLESVLGTADTLLLVAAHPGELLDIPTCSALRIAKRNEWLRRAFDALTAPAPDGAPGFSKRSAVYELGLELTRAGWPLTYRQIERVLDSAEPPPPGGAHSALPGAAGATFTPGAALRAPAPRQPPLFTDGPPQG
jgi:hypothetical protein